MKIKEEYKGSIITTTHNKLGVIKCDVDNLSPSEYDFYYKNGFGYIFDIPETPKTTVKKYKGIEDGE